MSQITEPTKDGLGSAARAIIAAVAIAFVWALLLTIRVKTDWCPPLWLWIGPVAVILFMVAVAKQTHFSFLRKLKPKVESLIVEAIRKLRILAAAVAIAFVWALLFAIWAITSWFPPLWLWIGLAVMIIFMATKNMPESATKKEGAEEPPPSRPAG